MSSIRSLDCRSFEHRIHQILDDRLTLTGDDLLMDHAARCAECEKILKDYDSVDDSVKLLPEELAEMLSEVEVNPVTGSYATKRLVLLASLAAMIVISLNVFHALDKPESNVPLKVASKKPTAPEGAVVHVDAAMPTQPVMLKIAQPQKRPTPDTSPFSPNFSVANAMPSIYFPTVPTTDDISQTLDSLEPVLSYSSSIPTVRPVHCSLNATINLLKQSLQKPERKPDLGFWIDTNMLAAA